MRTKLARPSFVQLLPILFFLLAAIPAAAIGVLLTYSAWERELQTVQEQHLQIARNLVAAHGGDIRAESDVGRGTTITFTVPLNAPVAS